MADNVTIPATGTGTATPLIATDEVAVNGGTTAHVQFVKLVGGGSNQTEGLEGTAANGLEVDVTRSSTQATTGSAVPATAEFVAGTDGTNARALKTDTSGELQVDVLTVPADPFGANADAASATGSISAKLRFIAATGIPVTSIAAGNNNIGDVDVASIAAGANLIGDVAIQPRTSGGWSVFNANGGDTYTALTNSAQAVKGSAGQLGGYICYNPNTSVAYVIIYNVAAASVTVGTTTAQMIVPIPPSCMAHIEFTVGIPFSTAISVAAATTAGGNTAPTTALDCVFLYK
jgi:hypothetical protein